MAQTPYTVDDLVKNSPNLKASWDPNTRTSSLLDTTSGKQMSWTSGQANNNGVLGGLYNDSNIVDPDKIKQFFGNSASPNNYSRTANTANKQGVNNNNIDWDSVLRQYAPAPAVDNSDQIKSQYEADLANQISLLRQAVANSKAKLEAQKPQIQQQANDLRGQVYTNARVSAIGNNEKLANSGLAGALYAGPQSGVSESSRIRQDTAMGNDINAVSRQEQQQLTDIANLILEQDRQENYGVQTLSAQNASALAQALMNESNRVYEQTNQNNQTNLSNLIAALGARNDSVNSDLSRAIQEAGLTGYYNGSPTMQKQQMDTGNRQWQQTFDYNQDRDTKEDQQWQQQFNEGIRQFDKQFSENQRQWNSRFEFDQKNQSFEQRQAQIRNAIEQGQLNQQEGQLQLQRDKFKADQDQQSLDNRLRADDKQNQAYNNYLQMGLDRINQRTNYQGESTPIYSTEQMLAWVRGLNLSPDLKAQLANDLGL